MTQVRKTLVFLIALEHFWFMILEMFLWQHPIGLKTFQMTPSEAEISAVLAANQGLYNSFLAVGLLWGLFHKSRRASYAIQKFFLICIVVAGVFGGFTAKPTILYVQAVPAFIAFLLMHREAQLAEEKAETQKETEPAS